MRVLDKNETTEVSGGLLGLLLVKKAVISHIRHRPRPVCHPAPPPPAHPPHRPRHPHC